jgi:excisionase family DNA binding protein
MAEEKKFLRTNEAAQFLGVSRSSLTNWVKQGQLGSGITPGGHYRFTMDELNAFAVKRGLDIPADRNIGPRRILMIEDDASFREFVRDALEVFSGYELREAGDGMQGALVVGSWRPDLIILDIRMPNMNGVEFLRLLRAEPDTAHIEVIVASAHLSEQVRAEIDELEVDIVLEKPVRLVKLVAAIEKLANLKLK